MNQIKILTSFSRLNDAHLEQKAELIVECLTDNVDFPNPKPTLDELKTAVTSFNAAIKKAKEGGRAEVFQKNAKRDALIALLNSLALYVQMEGNGDPGILVMTGFSLSKLPQPIGVLPKPQRFTAVPLRVGIVKLNLRAIYGAKSYRFEYRKKGDTTWQVVVNTKSMLMLTELESGVQYEFRVAGIGTNVERVYSDVLNSYIT